MSNITQVINVDKYLKIFKKGVHGSDQDQLLSSTGPFTVFAPTDLAFEKLEKQVMENLLEPQNRAKLADLINNHIVNGKIKFEDLKDGDMLTAINGKQLAIQVKNGAVQIGDIQVQQRDAKVSNGIIHLMDTVMV